LYSPAAKSCGPANTGQCSRDVLGEVRQSAISVDLGVRLWSEIAITGGSSASPSVAGSRGHCSKNEEENQELGAPHD
jgi:hypothetical protein